MGFLEAYLFVLLGVVTSIVLPIAYKATVGKDKAPRGTWFTKFFAFLKEYGWWIVVSLLGALVATMLTQDFTTPQSAFAVGLGWDSLWQRMSKGD